MPIEIINPAIPAAVKVTGIILNIDNTVTIYIDNAITARSPGNRYQKTKKIATANNPIIAGTIAYAADTSPANIEPNLADFPSLAEQ